MQKSNQKLHIDNYMEQANSLRFKLLAIVGKNQEKKEKIINYLKNIGWSLIDVGKELSNLIKQIEEIKENKDSNEDSEDVITKKVKEWFNEKPNKVILINANVLYHKIFTKISPIGAFKYRTRNKNTIIFLENEQLIGNRLSIGKLGDEEYTDQDILDIVIININEIKDEFEIKDNSRINIDINNLPEGAIGHYFNYKQIKDVIDIDFDLAKDESKKEIVESYIISKSLENQIVDFFDDLEKPNHKAVKIIGNYGSGKSHMIAFLISLIGNTELSQYVKNERVKQAINKINRKYKIVQFELMPGDIELSDWFYREIRKQIKDKYNIEIPDFDTKNKDINHKDNFKEILNKVKTNNPKDGLVIVIDEVSDFLSQKASYSINRDFQFLRVVAQFCQANDMSLVTSMQEDIYSSSKFKDIAASAGRIDARFQNIYIHKEDVNKVISERIVSKTKEQKQKLEKKLEIFSEKIEDVSNKIDEYVNLFPLTPFLLELFSQLPYFEKRGVIQFAQNNIKYILDKEFPYFITFDEIYNILERDPNRRNIEEIYKTIEAVNIVKDKVSHLIEDRYKKDALKIIKGLAVYSIWSKKDKIRIKDLAEKLMIISDNFDPKSQASIIIKKIRETTDNNYIKIEQNKEDGDDYAKFEVNMGVDPNEKIESKVSTIGDDEVEEELFNQIAKTLELDKNKYVNNPFVFDDECCWQSKCSYRKGYIILYRRGTYINELEKRDYSVNIISPYYKGEIEKKTDTQINIRVNVGDIENILYLKTIKAIRLLIHSKIMKNTMENKLIDILEGGKKGKVNIPGIKQRITNWFLKYTEYDIDSEQFIIRKVLRREPSNLQELLDNLKKEKLDSFFNNKYINHPNYPSIFTSETLINELNKLIKNIIKGEINNFTASERGILEALSLLEKIGDRDEFVWRESDIALNIVSIIKKNKNKVTDIQEIYDILTIKPYGLEKELINFLLVYLTFLGIIYLQQKGGYKLDIGNINTFGSLAQFEVISYAKIEENLSYDFAKRLLNVFGLNGAKIEKEKTRNEAFREYIKKLEDITDKINKIDDCIGNLERYYKIFLNIEQVKEEIKKIKEIDWEKLKIENPRKFNSISEFDTKLNEIKKAIDKKEIIYEAINIYKEEVHYNIEYMEKAIEILDKYEFLSTDIHKKKLVDIYEDTIKITEDWERFSEKSERNPLEGKFKSFKKVYIDIYYTKHEEMVGGKVEWDELNVEENEIYKKLKMLNKLKTSSSEFSKKIDEWNSIKGYKCKTLNYDSLEKHHICPNCNFPNFEYKEYKKIIEEIKNIPNTLENILEKDKKNTVKDIIMYKDNLDIVKIGENNKNIIKKIIETKEFPENFTENLISDINSLFREIEIIEISKEELINKFFEKNETLSIKDLKEAFVNFEKELRKNKNEDDIRIRLK